MIQGYTRSLDYGSYDGNSLLRFGVCVYKNLLGVSMGRGSFVHVCRITGPNVKRPDP